jgi:transcriptional regulator GlxA family with amidase domain
MQILAACLRNSPAVEWPSVAATRNYSIREVAFMSGFKSAAHFSRRFKATYGRPPRKYRDAQVEGAP